MRAYISHREQIKRHCLEAFAGGFRSEKLAGGCAGSSTTHNDLITDRLDILDRLAQVGDDRAEHREYIRKPVGA